MESSIGMETISYIKARVLEAKNGSQPPGYRQLLDQVYERLERLEQLVSNTPEIRECQNFESGRNSIRGMLDQFRQQDFDQQLYRMFSKDLSTATESYRKQARVREQISNLYLGVCDQQTTSHPLKTINEDAIRSR